MFIAFQTTPNPDALKFLPHARLNLGEALNVERDAAILPPLARALFELDEVLRLMLGEDFVTVTRRPDAPAWSDLKPQILAAIASQLAADPTPWAGTASPAGPDDAQVETEIRQVIALHVRPGAQRDGGDITVERFEVETGTLFIRMEGACNGCPSSQQTLRAGVEQIVRRFVPEVLRVEHLAQPPAPAKAPSWRRLVDRAIAGPSRAKTVFSHNGVARGPDA